MKAMADAWFAVNGSFPGLILVPQELPVGEAVRNICYLVENGDNDELTNLTVFLPL
jgi:hypothetical protein